MVGVIDHLPPLPMKRKVFLVDDHPLVREWLGALINRQADLEVCGEAASAPQAREGIEAAKPDIAVVDITLENGSGLELIKDLRVLQPKMAVVVLSMHDESLYAERAMRAGARGYLVKKETTKKILLVIREVLDGRLYVSGRFAESILEGVRKRPATSPIDQLSDRELEVFRMIGQGMKTREIGESLHISMKTVQVYCSRIKEKLKLAGGAQLMREAIRLHEAEAVGSL
jgi:DNA-binding NarL/FixJ family response regulator